MLVPEAEWIGKALLGLDAESISPLCNLGSSTGEYRSIAQPHINQWIFDPLAKKGVHAVHVDRKEAAGVDIIGDFTDPAFQADIRKKNFKALLCNNMLEHVTDPQKVALGILSMVPAGSYLLISVPCSFPYHLDPIDNCLRVDVAGLHAMFPGTRLIRGEVVEGGSYRDEMGKSGVAWLKLCARLLMFFQYRRWRSRVSYLRWWRRPYRISCILIRKE